MSEPAVAPSAAPLLAPTFAQAWAPVSGGGMLGGGVPVFGRCLHHTHGLCPGCGEAVKADPKTPEPKAEAKPPKISLVAQTRAPPEFRVGLAQLMDWLEKDVAPVSIAAVAASLLDWPVEELEQRLRTAPARPRPRSWSAFFGGGSGDEKPLPYPVDVLARAKAHGLVADTFVGWATTLFPKGSHSRTANRVARETAREMVAFVQQLADNVYAGPID